MRNFYCEGNQTCSQYFKKCNCFAGPLLYADSYSFGYGLDCVENCAKAEEVCNEQYPAADAIWTTGKMCGLFLSELFSLGQCLTYDPHTF